MANASRWSLSARQGFLACGFVTVGLFVLPCGAAMGSIPIAALGVAIGLLGPIVIVLSSVRANRPDVVGTAHVSQSSAPPTTGVTGPAELHLVVNAQGVHNSVVRIRDANAPLSKWPDVGANLPVLIPNGNPRRLQVLWDRVRPHRDLTMDDVSYAPYLEPDYPAEDYPAEDYPAEDYPAEDYPAESYHAEDYAAERVPDDRVPDDRVPAEGAPDERPPAEVYAEAVAGPEGHQADEPLVEQTAVIDPVTVAPAPPVPEAAVATASAPLESVVGVRRRPSPRPRRETVPSEPVAAVVTAATAAPRPAAETQPLWALPRRVPGATRSGPAENGIPTPPVPADDAETAEIAAETAEIAAETAEIAAMTAEVSETVRPDPYVAPYLTDDPEEAQQGLGGVHNVGVTMIVSDLQRSLAFYRDVLGLTEIDGGMGSAILVSGDSRVLLRQVAGAQPVDRPVVDLNLEVDDVHEAYERLRRQGVEFMHPPRPFNQGEQLEQWAATLRDPDGHVIALTHWEARL